MVSLSCARSCNQEHTLHFSEMGYDVGPQPAHVTRRHSGPWRKAVDALDEVGRGGSSNSRLPWGSPCLGARGGLLLLILAALASAQENNVRPLIVQAVDDSQLTTLKGNTHPLARAQFDRGAAPPDLPMQRMLLVLKRGDEQESALRKLLDDQQDKASPNYHKWLTPEQFGRQFGPADQDLQAVTSWLQMHGFQVSQVTKGRTVIEFSGTAAQVQEALHTSIHKYVV